MKKNIPIVLAALLAFANSAFAKQAVFNGDDYSISIVYNEKASPGDAVFARMKISSSANTTKKSKITKKDIANTEAILDLIVEGKNSRSADFYTLGKASKTSKTMLAGVPLSSWWTKDTKCHLKVNYKINGESKEFTLPFTIENKDFISETVELNAANTAIKTDTSTKRMDQINKLNVILSSINSNNVYTTRPFISPVQSERRTSFFADRRVYKYTSGQSSTSLHLGIDYGVPTGTEVRSPAEGKVVLAETRVSTGWSVIIEHLPGLYSIYYHMSELKVKDGDFVKPGTLIGLSGATGLATGPHLHWEMRLNFEAVNPDFFKTNFTFDPDYN